MGWHIPKSDELTEEDWKLVAQIPKYPEIDRTTLVCMDYAVRHGCANVFLNQHLDIEIKRDGSNLRLFKLGKDRYGLMSRHQYADDSFINRFIETVNTSPEKYLGLFRLADEGYTVFTEFFGMGNSPAGFDRNEPPSLVVIDIWLPDHGFVRRHTKEKMCEKFRAPITELIWHGEVKTDEEYWAVIKECINKIDEMGKEGVVIKTHYRNYGQFFAKEKTDKALADINLDKQKLEKPKPGNFDELYELLRLTKSPVLHHDLEPWLPTLDRSECMGAINKAHLEIGEKIFDKAAAMPKIAGKIKEECLKHSCKFPRDIFKYYIDYIKMLNEKDWRLTLTDLEESI